jgi:hypothetical protein
MGSGSHRPPHLTHTTAPSGTPVLLETSPLLADMKVGRDYWPVRRACLGRYLAAGI